jgi:hypothetical protein
MKGAQAHMFSLSGCLLSQAGSLDPVLFSYVMALNPSPSPASPCSCSSSCWLACSLTWLRFQAPIQLRFGLSLAFTLGVVFAFGGGGARVLECWGAVGGCEGGEVGLGRLVDPRKATWRPGR